MKYFKKALFICFIVSLIFSLFWTIGKFFNSDMPMLDRQTYSIMSGLKYLTAIALYIAWRVTPDHK
ncbi:TPA: hypothetical protein DEP30_02260 [Candidatus Nomurabacteria bacterium]|nr:MAG: hypothetical protein UR97_C0003G0040 [Candidatus Nomurabacteria bacterium GW2011_GWE2_36_115]KKP94092.1 MAG: hypothetical protein US00_C0003G0016 [Candidatus Nomurabacteria bacterium GW2011_GWF2_36_126]KKP96780.1 MAG: hypothetical protein US04_C0001G0282 [Candidatus Nomurabacteria bacterium GW2011_GWD2_36_14]KKP99616.1 MAG: hypothetical protein US08_C0001G0299 [Candidatus Nomurabacteria bacterium GW2011_GWF2_36_19]KKQ05468.1 MAG: hypothetical protein US17_C0004G0040 [Candidatus Nomuraba